MAKMQKEHFEILLEQMESNLQVVMEAFSSLNNKVDSNSAELALHIQGLENRLIGVEIKLGKVATDLDAHRNSTELHQAPRKRQLKQV